MKGVVFGISNNEFTIGVLAKTASDLQGNLGGGPERGPESLLQDSVATSEEPPLKGLSIFSMRPIKVTCMRSSAGADPACG